MGAPPLSSNPTLAFKVAAGPPGPSAWRDADELARQHSSEPFRSTLLQLFAIRTFFVHSFLPTGYQAPSRLAHLVVLNSAGNYWFDRLSDAFPSAPAADKVLAIFGKLFHHDLLVDLNATNVGALIDILTSEVIAARVRHPWVYDRLLYDRFFEICSDNTDKLNYEQTLRLLQGTPAGVFQVSDTLVGPFGVLRSLARRALPPRVRAHLWHCPDLFCAAVHVVQLATGETTAGKAFELLSEEGFRLLGPPSEWEDFCWNMLRRREYFNPSSATLLPWLVGSSFADTELRSILKRLIELYPGELRPLLPTKRRGRSAGGSPSDIASTVTRHEGLQLILLAKDEMIAEVIDALIEKSIIKIPTSEIRRPHWSAGFMGATRITWECSRLGVRPTSATPGVALRRLRLLIEDLHTDPGDAERLDWQLRHIEAPTRKTRLNKYLAAEPPSRVVQDLVFSSAVSLQRAFKHLRFGSFSVPASRQEENRLVDRILWKLGFDVALYPQGLAQLKRRVDSLVDVSTTGAPYSDSDEERIRSTAVNVFVTLEEVLDTALSFSTWALLADHYAVTRQQFNIGEARGFMAFIIGGSPLANAPQIVFDPIKNTLYPLIRGFTILADLCHQLLEGDRTPFLRSQDKIPRYASKPSGLLFPFLHSVLFLDLRSDCQQQAMTALGEAAHSLDEGRVAGIRNRIEHRRINFPTEVEIKGAAGAVKRAVCTLEEWGLLPTLFGYSGTSEDEYGRTATRFVDAGGREVIVPGPSVYGPCRQPPLDVAQIIMPRIYLGQSLEPVRFLLREDSEYREMWKDYPRKRAWRAPEDEESERIEETEARKRN